MDVVLLAVADEVVLEKERVRLDLVHSLRAHHLVSIALSHRGDRKGRRRHTGQTPVASTMPWIWWIEKFETPIALTLPVSRSLIIAFQVSTRLVSKSRTTQSGLFGSMGSKSPPYGNATGQWTTDAGARSA